MAPTTKIRRDIRIFISAVSRELGTVRKLVKASLESIDYHAIEQTSFPPSYRELLEKLRERIASCDAMIHIVGLCYGAEPDAVPDAVPRRSYTQWEYAIARELKKPVYVFLTTPTFPSDPHESESPELQLLQEEYRTQLMATGYDYNPTTTPGDLDQKIRALQLKVERLEQELTQVDDRVAAAHQTISKWGVAAVISSVISIVLVAAITYRLSDPADQGNLNIREVQDEVKTAVVEELLAQIRSAQAVAEGRTEPAPPATPEREPDNTPGKTPEFEPDTLPLTESSKPPVWEAGERLQGRTFAGLAQPNTLLFFHAMWSAPCAKMRSAVAKLIREGYPIQMIDIDASPELSRHLEIMSLPTTMTVVDSKIVSGTCGYMNPDDLKALAQAVVPKQNSMPNVLK